MQAWTARNTPFTLTANPSSQACGVVVVTLPYRWIPAEVTRMSRRLNSSATRSTAPCIAAASVTSAGAVTARPPPALILATTSSAAARSLEFTATAAPCSASSSATACPMPLDAPVTNAARPSCSPTSGYLHTSPDERNISCVKRAPVDRRADPAAGEGATHPPGAPHPQGSANEPVSASEPEAQGASVLTRLDRRRSGARTSDRVYAELAAAIRDLRLPPGQGLSETELAVRLGVSRTPVREAISRLVDARLVSVGSQVGTRGW